MMRQSLLAIALVIGATAPSAADPDYVTKQSPHSVADTVARLTTAIESAGAKIAATVDHAGAAAGVGMELADNVVVIFGNPRLGTPAMQESPGAGLHLPLKVQVFEDAGGRVLIHYERPEEMLDDFGLDEDSPTILRMTGALDKLTDAAIAE